MTTEHPTPRRAPLIPSHIFWPGMVVAILLTGVCAVAITVVAALSDKSFAIETNYYQKAIDWDQTAAQNTHNIALGWDLSVTPENAPDTSALGRVVVELRTGEGVALDGGVIHAELFHHARRADAVQLTFVGLGGGRYAAEADLSRAGLWELRAEVVRGPETFTESRTFEVRPK